jgi:hypothetical protein
MQRLPIRWVSILKPKLVGMLLQQYTILFLHTYREYYEEIEIHWYKYKYICREGSRMMQ